MAIFYIISIITIVFAIYMVTTKYIFRSILSFFMTILGISGIYFFSKAEFLGVIQILIYGGTIITITLFIFMLTPDIEKTSLNIKKDRKILAAISCIIFLGILIYTFSNISKKIITQSYTIKEIGRLFLTTYALPFEIISVLLLSTLIGAIIIARKH